ncbi:MAG: hypothetical protein ACI85Q_000882 [Salibacteraceae bacterium]
MYKERTLSVNFFLIFISYNLVSPKEIVHVKADSIKYRVFGSVLMTMGGVVGVPSLLALPRANL